MNNETYKTLYEKNENEFKPIEVDYIQKLTAKAKGDFLMKLSLISTPLIFVSLTLLLSAFGMFSLNLATFAIMACEGLIIGGALSLSFVSVNRSAKSLGLSKTEWKELKKSGRLKELMQIVKNKEFATNLSKDVVANGKLNEADIKLDTIHKDNIKLTNLQNEPDYEKIYIEERVQQLNDEEGYLIRSLAQIKQEKNDLLNSTKNQPENESENLVGNEMDLT